MNTEPDIPFGSGDTAPVIQGQAFQPDNADGTPGLPQDLRGASGVMEWQIQDGSLPRETDRTIVIDQTTDQGIWSVDMLATGGAPPPNTDYWVKFVFQLPGGYQLTYPVRGTGHDLSPDRAYLWLHTSPDFPTPP